jgi:hypothetical protein
MTEVAPLVSWRDEDADRRVVLGETLGEPAPVGISVRTPGMVALSPPPRSQGSRGTKM